MTDEVEGGQRSVTGDRGDELGLTFGLYGFRVGILPGKGFGGTFHFRAAGFVLGGVKDQDHLAGCVRSDE